MSWLGYGQILPGDAMDSSEPKKPSKPRSFPPPGEALDKAQTKAKTKASPKAKALAKKPAGAKKTPAKMKPSATNSKNASQGAGSKAGQVKAGNGVIKQTKAMKRKQAMEKEDSTWAIALDQTPATAGSFSKSRKQEKRQSVLMRATARTQHLKGEQEGGKTKNKFGSAGEKFKAEDDIKVFRVMDLPEELRAMIWREAVVYSHCFVRPEEKLQREQPDLAMTSRQVRREVLPIFYAENIFAINITRPMAISPLIQKWAIALQGTTDKPGWFSVIRKWSFSYVPKVGVCSVKLAGKALFNDVYVAVTFRRRRFGGIFWDAKVEIHREARCILPKYEEFGMCKVQTAPAWLNKLVIGATEAGQGGEIGKEMIIDLAKAISGEILRLSELTCKEVSKEEVDSGFIKPSCTGALTLGTRAKKAVRDS